MSRRRYLVAYDIREDRRLRQVHLTMKHYGYPLQYSVFVCDLDFQEKLAMRVALGEIIAHAVDSIAIIDLGDAQVRGQECFEFMGARPFDLPTTGPTIV